jgi:hypothetical protein
MLGALLREHNTTLSCLKLAREGSASAGAGVGSGVELELEVMRALEALAAAPRAVQQPRRLQAAHSETPPPPPRVSSSLPAGAAPMAATAALQLASPQQGVSVANTQQGVSVPGVAQGDDGSMTVTEPALHSTGPPAASNAGSTVITAHSIPAVRGTHAAEAVGTRRRPASPHNNRSAAGGSSSKINRRGAAPPPAPFPVSGVSHRVVVGGGSRNLTSARTHTGSSSLSERSTSPARAGGHGNQRDVGALEGQVEEEDLEAVMARYRSLTAHK